MTIAPPRAHGLPVHWSTSEVEIRLWLDRGGSVPDLSLLSPEELQRGARYRVPEKQRQFFWTRCLGRTLLAERLQVAPTEIQWSTSGPPVISVAGRTPEISISVSHSGPVIALAIGSHPYTLGIDIERTAAVVAGATSYATIAFTQTELDALTRIPPRERPAASLQLWTIKEAVAKSLRQPEAPQLKQVHVRWDFQNRDWLTALQQAEVSFTHKQGRLTKTFVMGCFQRCSLLEAESAPTSRRIDGVGEFTTDCFMSSVYQQPAIVGTIALHIPDHQRFAQPRHSLHEKSKPDVDETPYHGVVYDSSSRQAHAMSPDFQNRSVSYLKLDKAASLFPPEPEFMKENIVLLEHLLATIS